MTHTVTYSTFLEACSQPGCPLCQMEHAADLRFMDRLFYELVNDYGVRTQLRASLGLCAEHGHLAAEELQGNALGLTIIYDDMLRIVLESLDARGNMPAVDKKCLACSNREELTGWMLADLSKHILDEETLTALKSSQGLCFGHLRQALEHLRAADKRNALIAIQRDIMKNLRAELAEHIRKNDYRFIGEEFGPERDAWKRAVKMGKK